MSMHDGISDDIEITNEVEIDLSSIAKALATDQPSLPQSPKRFAIR